MPFHEFGNVELGFLQYLYLANEAVLDGEDRRGFPGNVLTDWCRDQLLDERLEVSLGTEFRHDGGHFGADGTDLCALGVAGRLDLVVLGTGEGDAKESDDVSVGSSAVDVGLDDRLLLSDEGAELVSGHVHSVKVQQAIVSLDVFDAELDLAEGIGFVLVEVGERDLNDTSLEVIRSDLGTLCLGDQGLSAVLDGKDGRCDQFVPFLLQKGINRLFAASLL